MLTWSSCCSQVSVRQNISIWWSQIKSSKSFQNIHFQLSNCSCFLIFSIWLRLHIIIICLSLNVPKSRQRDVAYFRTNLGFLLSPLLHVPKHGIYSWKAKVLEIQMMYANPGYNLNCGHSKHLCKTSHKHKKMSKSPIKPHSILRKDKTSTKTVLLRWQGSSLCTPVK